VVGDRAVGLIGEGLLSRCEVREGVMLAFVLGRSESEDMPLDWEEMARLEVDALIPGALFKCDKGCTVLAGLLSSKGIGFVVVRLLSCSRIIRMDRTRLSCTTYFQDIRSSRNSVGGRQLCRKSRAQGHTSRRKDQLKLLQGGTDDM
jgi:hypothetical protein